MKITFSNKKANKKPTKQTVGIFFGKEGTQNRIQFKTGNFDINTFEKIISNGHVLGYQCENDDCMNRKAGYIGTQYIIVDVDAVDYTIDELLSIIKYKPTIIHTSYSNLTEVKNYKYCYHLIYCLNEVIYGEDNFNIALSYFANDYWNMVDKNAKDCHRIAFTSNSTLPNYEYRNLGIVYDVKEIIKDNDDNFDDFFSVPKFSPSTLSYSITNNVAEEKNGTVEIKEKNVYSVDDTFFNDLMSLQYSEFLSIYKSKYMVKYETTFDKDINKSFVDLSSIDYYIVNPTKYKWNTDKNKWEKVLVKDGNRHCQLFKDAIQFKYVNPSITLEELVISLVDDYFTYYDKTNCNIDKKYILNLAKDIYSGDYKGMTTNKSLAVNKEYFQNRVFTIDGVEIEGTYLTKQQRTGIAFKDMKDDELISLYDNMLSVEENYNIIKDITNCKKSRLIEALKRNNIKYFSEKENKKLFVVDLYKNNSDLSIRDLANICKDNGIVISKSTVQRYIDEYKNNISEDSPIIETKIIEVLEEIPSVPKNDYPTLSISYHNNIGGEKNGTLSKIR